MSKSYPIVFWIFTVLGGPVIWMLYKTIIDTELGILLALPTFIIAGLILSLPTLIVYFICYNLLVKFTSSALIIKLILITIGIIGIEVTMHIIGGSIISSLTIAYSIATILSGLISNPKLKPSVES